MKKKWLLIGSCLFLALCLVLAGFGWWFIMRDIPSIKELRELQPTRLSKVLAVDGTVIGWFPPAGPPDGMVVLPEQEIPGQLKLAFIAAEDATFYKHAGIDFSRIVSALIKDIKAASYVQGASTITQQVVRTYLLGREKTMYRKVREAVLAFRIEKALSKEQILSLYLNRIYLGSGASGVGAASLRYFGKECKDLDLAEMALIAGLAPAPHRYSPLNSFTSAKRRQWYVLSRMVQQGDIQQNEAAEAYREPLRITGKSVAMFTRYPYVTDYVKTLAIQKYGPAIIDTGIVVKTTIVPRLQDAAELAVRKGVIELEMRQGQYRGPLKGFDEEQKANMLAFQKNQIAWQGLKNFELYWAELVSVQPLKVSIGTQILELPPSSYAWIKPQGAWDPKGVLALGDMLRLCYIGGAWGISQDPLVQGALVAFDVQSAEMQALVGGVEYARNQFNRAIYAKRQSGSAIKPFIYAAALDKGFTAASIILDTPLTYKSDEFDEGWRPKNYENKYFGPTSLRTGLVMSRNVVTVKILKQIGLSYAIDYMRRFDMDAQLPRNLSLALGTGVVTPYGLTKGYGVFAANGWPFEPILITSITSYDGATSYFHALARPTRELTEEQPPAAAAVDPNSPAEADVAPGADPDAENDVAPDATIDGADDTSLAVGEGSSGVAPEAIQEVPSVISEQTAYIITNMMSDVVREGTGWRVRALGRPVAGKTGTSDDFKDAWFIGYTPTTLCGVWIGYDDSIPLGPQEAGGKAAAPIFLDFMSSAVADLPAVDFRVPVGIVFAQVDRQTGLIAAQASENTQFECFKEQSLPARQESVPEDLMLKEVF